MLHGFMYNNNWQKEKAYKSHDTYASQQYKDTWSYGGNKRNCLTCCWWGSNFLHEIKKKKLSIEVITILFQRFGTSFNRFGNVSPPLHSSDLQNNPVTSSDSRWHLGHLCPNFFHTSAKLMKTKLNCSKLLNKVHYIPYCIFSYLNKWH